MSITLPTDLASLLASNGWKSKLEAIQLINNKGMHLPETVLKLGASLITSSSWNLGEQYWEVCEAVFYASLDCQAGDWMKFTLKRMKQRFGSTPKISRLEGIYLEYTGKFTEAEKIYDGLLATNPLDKATWKRKAAMYRTAGSFEQAIQELNSYLDVFQEDKEAWEELSDVYLTIQHYSQAMYCYEEVLLASPENFWVVLKYGEIVYSIGGLERMLLARKYFIQALVLNPKCVRAMWALFQCTSVIHLNKPDPVNTKIKEKVAGSIEKEYKGRIELKKIF